MYRREAALLAAGIFLLSSPALADDETPPVVGGRTWIQHQIEGAKAAHREIAAITVVAKRDGDKAPVVFGSTADTGRVFKPATPGADGTTTEGGHLVVREALWSSSRHRLGTIEIAFAPTVKSNAVAEKIATEVQARMARVTLSAKNAADPYPFDKAWGPDTYAQELTEKTIARHPDLLVMMIHATPPGHDKNLIIGSNIGRFGKIADEDDARVIDKGSTNLEVGGDNDRFETELPLNDASGTRIGALGLVFGYKVGQDKEAIHSHGLAIRDEIAKQIPNNAALFRKTR